MALFTTKKENTEKAAAKQVVDNAGPRDLSWVLESPRITEKASDVQQRNVYVFDVSPRASKQEIKEAVRALYKVEPVKVHTVHTIAKIRRNMRTGKYGKTAASKKAYIYLKKGETITIA